jgi:hypothetical protein
LLLKLYLFALLCVGLAGSSFTITKQKVKMEAPTKSDQQGLYQQNSFDPEEAAFDFVDDYQPEPTSHTLGTQPPLHGNEPLDYSQNDQNLLQYDASNDVVNGYHDGLESDGYQRQRLSSLSAELKVVRRESLNEITEVVNTPSNPYVQNEFGKLDNDGGLFTLIPLETQLQVTYTWNVPRKDLLESDKLVSLPFGPKDWSWQIMYPRFT